MRPTVFGMMDGLVSNFALIAGVAGASAAAPRSRSAGLAGLVGGAFSMATGEYVSVQSQNESTRAEIEVERHELHHNAEAELAELAQMYVARGVEPGAGRAGRPAALARPRAGAADPRAGGARASIRTSCPARTTAGSSLLSFRVGAFLPLLPYLFGANSVLISAVLAWSRCSAAGALTSRFTARSWLHRDSSADPGRAAAAVTFGVGHLVGANVG